jgi:transcriptional regulator GlxA family with amidase domain
MPGIGVAEMPIVIHFMPMRRRVILVAFDGAQGLDVFGPAEAFAGVGRMTGQRGYEVLLAAVRGGRIRATSGLSLIANDLSRIRPRASDTVLVVGGEDSAVRRAVQTPSLVSWVARSAGVVRRIGSVCSGAFVLAAAGILDGRRAATHWSACSELAAFRPSVTVDPQAIFVKDGRVWTSAGVTTGIDMTLAMVEEDFGRRVADAVAARLVLYARRPGFQSQFSDALVAQTSASDPLGPVVAWVRANLSRAIDVGRLARKSAMSVRTLHRRCAEELDTTPAKLIERIRIDQARALLGTTRLATKAIAAQCGFGSAARMTRAFERTLGVAPGEYRLMKGALPTRRRVG